MLSGLRLPVVRGMPEATTIEKDMALTHEDFFRTIPQALGRDDFERSDDGVVLSADGKRLEIRLGKQGERRLGLFKIPTTQVTLMFSGYDAEEMEAAIKRFDITFKKGGG